MKNRGFSIVVPIYNAVNYLSGCVESIVNSVNKQYEYEIILVDDGSLDGSAQECDKLKSLYANITVVHKENGGVASARNKGVEIAKYDYILFFDADDYVDKNINQALKNVLDYDDVDLFLFNHYNEINSQVVISKKIKSNFFIDVDDNSTNKKLLNNLSNSVCNKIFKKSIIENAKLKFSSYKNAEDMLFVLKYVSNCKKIKGFDLAFYYYVERENSAMTAMNVQKIFDAINACNEGISYADNVNKPISKQLKMFASRTAYFTLKMCVKIKKEERLETIAFLKKNKETFKYSSNIKSRILKALICCFGFKFTLFVIDLFY